MIKVQTVKARQDYSLEVRLTDGRCLIHSMRYIFQQKNALAEPLKDPVYFRDVTLADGVVTWPSGFGLDPIKLAKSSIEFRVGHSG